MSILKLSKNDIIRKEDEEEKIKIKRTDLSFDSAMISGWEQANRQALEIINNYNNRINKSEWLDEEDRKAYKKAINSYVSTTNRLRGINKTVGEGYSEDDEKGWLDAVASLNKGYDDISSFYGQFASDKVYSDWLAQTESDEAYKANFSNIDVGKASQGWSAYLADEEKSKANAPSAWEETIIRGFSTSSDNPFNLTFNNVVYDYRNDTSYARPNENWTEEQKNAFGQLYLESPEKAFAFAEEVNNRANKEEEEARTEKIQKLATDNFGSGLGHTIGAIAAAPFGLADYLDDLAKTAAGREITSDGFVSPFEYSQAVTGGISTHLNEEGGTLDENIPIIGGKGWGDVYGLGTSIAQSMASAYTLGSAGTLVSYFGQGAAAGVDDALSRGATDEQAILYGAALGAFEGVAEKIGVDNLFSLGSSSTVKGLIKNILSQAGAEGGEEMLTAVMGNIADAFIMQDKSNFAYQIAAYRNKGLSESDAKWRVFWDSLEGIAFDTIAGAVSGGVSGGLHSGVNTAVTNAYAKKNYSGQTENLLIEAANIENSGKVVDKYIDKYGKKGELSGWNISHLLEITDTQKVKSAVEAQLQKLGEGGDISALADAITKQAQGIELSKKEQVLIDNSKFGQRVVNGLDRENIKSGEYDTRWAKDIGTRRMNADIYNKSAYDLLNDAIDEERKAALELSDKDAVTENTPVKENAIEGKISTSTEGIKAATESAEFNDINFRRAIQSAGINMSVTDALAPTIKKYVSGEITSRAELADVIRSEFGDKIGTYKLTEDNLFSLVNVIDTEASKTANGASASASKVSQAITKATMHDSEGNDVDVKVAKIADVENGEASLELEDGKTVKASDVDFGDSGVGIVYKAAAEMVSGVGGFNLDAANLMVRGFNPSGTEAQALAYTAGFNKAYREGALGYPLSALATGEATSKLTPKQREMAYNLGKAYGEGKVAEKQAKIDSILTKKDENISKKASKKGKVYFDGSAAGKSLTKRQRANINGLKVVAEAMGIDIHVFESPLVDGKRVGENGSYDPVTKTLRIDLHAGVKGDGLILYTASHELTHHIREISPAKFKIFADALLEEYTNHGVSLDALIEEKLKHLERNGRLEGKTEEQAYDLAYEEVVADACETMLVDSNAMEALSKKLYAKDKSLWETVKKFIGNLIAKIKAIYKNLNPDSAEANLVRDMVDSAERLQKLWADALIEASKESNASKGVSAKGELKYQDRAVDTNSTEYKINTSMTMAEAKRMIETAYKVNNIAEYYEGEYANAEDWLKKAGSDEVEMYIENDFDLQAKYVNSNEDILNEEYRISDVLDAYLAGTLIGKEKPKPKRLDVSQSTKLEDSRFYSPQKIKDAKATFELAKQKAVGKDTAAINRARAEILLFAHNKGAAELLGVTQADLNKKLRSWSNYSATARNISERINAGVAEENRWTGIENSSYINKAKVTNEDIERLVASVEGDSKGFERKYIARVMLAADTHIDYSGLKFKFASSQQVNADNNSGGNSGGRVLGFYDDTNRQIEVTYDKPNTVAHEMGHYIDAQWGRELVGSTGSHLFLTRGINADIVRERYGEPGVQFLNNFKLFINSLSDVNQTYNSYYNDRGEIFARFFARFIEWTDNIATGNKYYSYESTMYGDKFTQAQYVEFARLLQEKALLDGSALTANNRSQNEKGGDAARSGINYSLEETVDGRLVAVVDDDILSGIYTGTWDKATAEKAKNAAKTALQKFKDGIAVKGITAKVNRNSRREYTRSNYSEALRKHDPNTYADKLRAASVVDDVVIAATSWNRDGGLTHPRKDNFVDFDRGQTLIMSGANKYYATVIVGITANGDYVLHDVEDMKPAQFDIKNPAEIDIKNEGALPTVTPNESFDDILKDSNGDIIPQNSNSVKRKFSDRDSSYMDAVNRGDMETAREMVYEAADKALSKSKITNRGLSSFGKGSNELVIVHHATNAKFTVFDKAKIGSGNGGANYGKGFYFSAYRSYVDEYGGDVGDYFLDIRNPFIYDTVDKAYIVDMLDKSGYEYDKEFVESYDEEDFWDADLIDDFLSDALKGKNPYNEFSTMLQNAGFDGIVVGGGDEIIAFDSNQIKSADPVTYDENGNVIPLSERFNPKNIDIRDSDRRADVSNISRELEKAFVEPKDVVTLADGYFDNYGGVMNKSEMRYDFLHAMQTMLEKSDDAYERAFEEIESIAEELVYNPKNLGSVADDFREMKNHIRSIRFKVQDRDKPEFGIYGGFGTFRKEHMGKLTLANNGISVDSVYMELQGLYGTSYFPDVNTVAEQLMVIADIVDTPLSAVADTEYATEGASDYTAQEIVAKFADFISASYKKEQENKAKNTTKYINYRNPDSYSNRSLLANALETAVQNDIERNKLEQYKQKINLINAEEQKLLELRTKIKELSFKKGPRDTEAIRNLQFEANQAANRINTYDKQLLNLESTKALRGVLEREKAQARKRDAQKYKEAIDRYREKSAKTQRELMDRYQESRKRATEGRNKTAMRYKIKDLVKELNTLLLNPTAKKHIKEELRKEVADALSAINMDTVGADERVAMYNNLIAKERNPDVIAELTKTRDRIQLQGDNLKEKLNNLQLAYEKIKNTDDIELNLAYQEVIHNSIKAVSEKIGNTSIRNMTLEQLEMVYDLFSMIRHTIRDANKSFKEKKGQTIMQMAEAVNDQVRTVGGQPYKRNAISASLQRIGWTFLKPLVAFRTIGSVTFTNMYKELRNGEDTFYGDVKEAQAFIEEQKKKHGYKSWDMKKAKSFTAKSGKTFDLTLEQMMSLYAYSKRDQAHDHIIEGGVVFEDALLVEKNKLGVPIKYEVTTKDAFNLSEETFAEIANSLTTEQKAFVDEMQAYLSDNMGAKGNEVSMKLLGVKLFKEKFYLPIKSSQYYMNFKTEEAGEVKLKSPAFSKETVKHANNPIVIHNFTDLWAEHINDMSMYHSFVLALEDFTRVYNYKTKTDSKVETMDTKATLETAYPGVTQYINKFLKDMNGGVRSETVGWAEKLTSLSKKGAVLGSASVTIQQPSAVMRAMAYINPKYFVTTAHKSINLAKHKQDWAELKKYAPIAGIKEMGRFDVGMGQGTVDWIKSDKTVLEKAEDFLSLPPAFMDEVTWISIWNAVKRETVHNNPKLSTSSEEFLQLAGERFTEVISMSQVYDSVFSRSDLMRNKSWIAKSLTAYMAEPSTTLNMIWDSWVQAKRSGTVKGFAKAITTTGAPIVAATVLNAALKSIIMAMRDDDEDESYAEKYLEHFVGDLKDSLNPLGLIPFVKDIVSIFNGYDVERMDMAMFSDLKKAIDAFDSDSKTLYDKWSGLVGAISAFFGVPVKNVERDIRGFITTHFGKTEETTLEGMLNAIVEGWTGKENSNSNQLYNAYLRGDKEQIKRVEGRFKDQSDIDTALRKALRENDPRMSEAAEAYFNGDYATYNKLREEIIAEGNFPREIIMDALKAEYNYIKKKAEEDK